MTDDRSNTLFCLRYAVRVLERQMRLQAFTVAAFKFASLISGSGALVALVGQNTPIAIALGVAFAVFQAMEVATDPASRRAQAVATRLLYARVLAGQAALDDTALEAAYQAVVAEDDIVLSQSLRDLAYDDVVRERGMDQTHLIHGHALVRALS